MKKLLSLALAFSVYIAAFAQLAAPATKKQPDPRDYSSEPAVFLVDERKIEFKDGANNELTMFKTLHRVIQVNDDRGIESFNKLYLPGGENNKMISLQARTMLKNGKVIEVDQSSIKDYTDEDGSEYKIFAFPGIEKGCTLEYTYTYERSASLFGIEVFQTGIPVVKSKLEIVSPPRLIFEARAFNGVPEKTDTVSSEEKRSIALVAPELREVQEEKYSNYSARLYRVEYKLSYNASKSTSVRVFTWNELAKRVYTNYTDITEKDKKKTESLIKDLKIDAGLSAAKKIALVENYLKKNIMVQKELYTEAGQSVEQILKSKIAGTVGIMRVYGAILDKLDIPFQFVLSGDRNNYTLDKNFENWNIADNPLLYFPDTKKYLAPTRPDYRYPWIAPEWGNTMALHCKTTSLGNIKTAFADLRPVILEDFSTSSHNMESTVKIFPKEDSLLVEMKQTFTGYSASLYRSAFNFAPAEEQKNFMKELVKFGTNSEQILESKVEHKEFESYTENLPVTLTAKVKANQLMERAGNKILLKIGEIIGQQVEMYQEKPRQFPVDIDYPHVLYRTIHIEIPEGYKVKNPESLNIRQVFPEAAPSMRFESTYKQEGKTILVTIKEEYQQVEYAVDVFEPFKKIINAAADFNKVVLVLEKL